jgi:dihydroxyacid dehydratase/phosphogluconate dehydratase
MVRVSDARMSGTAFGTIVLHVSPEAAAGGPLSLVRDGDVIRLDVFNGRLDLLVDPSVLEARSPAEPGSDPLPRSRWATIQRRIVTQANLGADLDVSGEEKR